MVLVTVRTGYWADYEFDGLLVHRLTLSSQHALVLIAVLSVFDALVGNFAWTLISTVIFQARATERPRDTLFHQQQILLRNASDAWTFTRQAIKLGWSWRKSTGVKRPLLRTWGLAFLAAFVALSFAAAGIGSSRIASTGDVLIISGNCGYFDYPMTETKKELALVWDVADSWQHGIALRALSYAQNCYPDPTNMTIQGMNDSLTTSSATTPLADCNVFTKSTLAWNYRTGHPCPFGNACSVNDTDIIRIESGLLNSQDDLGINTTPENRIAIRRIETCSPLTLDGYSNGSFYDLGNNFHAATYSYGMDYSQPMAFDPRIIGTNVTFVYSKKTYDAADVPYTLSVSSPMGMPPSIGPAYVPLPELNPNNDTYWPMTLMFLANRVLFEAPVNDTWFYATTAWNATNGTEYSDHLTLGLEGIYYNTTEPGRVLACLEQVQVCNPNSKDSTGTGPKCTAPLNDWWAWTYNYGAKNDTSQLEAVFEELGLNDFQCTQAYNILNTLSITGFNHIASLLGPRALSAYQYLAEANSVVSQGLPDYQWQIEMTNLFALSLAFTQQAQVEQITGPAQASLAAHILPYPATDTADNTLCENQKIRNTAYQSFSVLGLALNFIIGTLIILAVPFSQTILPRLLQWRKLPTMNRDQWYSSGNLQLHRRAYRGVADWSGEESVPLTSGSVRFAAHTLKTSELQDWKPSTGMARVEGVMPFEDSRETLLGEDEIKLGRSRTTSSSGTSWLQPSETRHGAFDWEGSTYYSADARGDREIVIVK